MKKLQARLYEASERYVAPILESYLEWVLEGALHRNIKTLYFLARDGYVLHQIAQMLCEAKKIDIRCRYLYCSRMALRMPTYHLIGDEAYDLLFLGGYHVTAASFLERAGITYSDWDTVLAEAGFAPAADIHQEIAYAKIGKYREMFLHSRTFHDQIKENSLRAYPAAAGYMKQEGLLDQPRIGIVDSGWTGSVQRSLRQLLQAEGYKGSITGFYFGMYADPPDPADGEYLTWFFSGHTEKRRKVWFSNNLFECILSAPHGMTTGYARDGGRYVPALASPPEPQEKQLIEANAAGILAGVKHVVSQGLPPLPKEKCAALLYRLMGCPTREIAETYGQFIFCDDVTETYHFALASGEQQRLLKNYIVLPRVWRKLKKAGSSKEITELFWPCGTAAFVCDPVKRCWYRANYLVWEWLKYTIK